MAEGVKLTDEELALVKKLLEKANQPIQHEEGDDDCFCEMDIDPIEATNDEDLPPAVGGVVG